MTQLFAAKKTQRTQNRAQREAATRNYFKYFVVRNAIGSIERLHWEYAESQHVSQACSAAIDALQDLEFALEGAWQQRKKVAA